jgi:hypothetical protein
MGKIFSVEFQFVNRSHSALVSVYKKENKSIYHIQLIDGSLKQIFATEHIRYREDEFQRLEFYKDPVARAVFNNLNAAIDKVLSSHNAVIKWLFPSLKMIT